MLKIRFNLAMQLSKTLIAKGFKGGAIWDHCILVGTSGDQPQVTGNQEKHDKFKEMVNKFFQEAPTTCLKLNAVVGLPNDHDQLRQAIANLPAAQVVYEPPSEAVLAQALAKTLGLDETEAFEQLKAMRASLAKVDEGLRSVMMAA